MDGFNNFCQSNLGVIYGVNGLAFFVTGIAVALERGRASNLALSRALPFLAAFGLGLGLHEWIEMFQLMGATSAQAPLPDWSEALSLLLLALSFVLLMEFALRLVRYSEDAPAGGWSATTLVFAATYLLSLLAYRAFAYTGDDVLFWTVADIMARYVLGITAAALACWAMLVERRAFLREGYAPLGRDLVGAALAFAWFALLQFVVPPSPYFPSSVLNTATFQSAVGIPVQFFRAAVVGVLVFFVIRVMRVFELEYARRLDALNQARFDAQANAARDLTVLYETCRILGATLDLSQMLNESLDRLVSLLGNIRAGAIFLYQPDDRTLVLRAICVGEHGGAQSVRVSTAPCAPAFLLRARDAAERACERRDIAYSRAAESDPVLAIPLLSGDSVIGALCLAHEGAFANFAVMQTLARQLVIAIENAQLYAQVQEKERVRGELLQRAVSAQEEERKRLARDLHDQTGQTLSALAIGLSSVGEMLSRDPAHAQQHLESLQGMSTSAIADLHRFVADLRPSLLDDLGLVAALRAMAKQVEERGGIAVEVAVDGPVRRLGTEIETVLYRIAQEALTNTLRHAQARGAWIALQFGPERIRLTVRDDGRGFVPSGVGSRTGKQRAWGLLGMQERAELVGGTLCVESAPGEGTCVTVDVPLC